MSNLATAKRWGHPWGSLLRYSTLVAAFVAPLVGAGVAEAGPKVASMYCSSDFTAQSDVQKKLQDLKLFDKVDNVDMSSAAPSLSTLQQYDAILVWADTSRGCSDPTNTGNVLAQYVDAGGGVVQILPYYLNYTYSNLSGDFYSRYGLVNQGGMSYLSSLSLGTKPEAHPTTDGVATVGPLTSRYCYYRTKFTAADLRNGGKIVANWSDGNGMVVVGSPNGHNRVDLNMYVPSGDVSSGCMDPKSDAFKLIGQSLIWASNPLRATPSLVDFGDVPVGTTSLPIGVDIVNTGANAITLSADMLGATGEFTAKLLGGTTLPVTLNMGDKIRAEFTVRPTATGKRQTTYTLSTSTPGASGIAIPLSTNGLGPVIKVTPQQIAFGGMPSGAMPRSVTMTVTNTGGGLLNLRAPVTLSDSTNFQLINPPTTPLSLSAGASVNFDVKFTPMTETRYTANMIIPYNDGSDKNLTVPITGSFGKPKISVPGSIVMSPVRVMQTGPEQSLTITNSGLADLTISAVSFTGKDPGDFLALTMPTMGMPIVIPAGGSGELKVQCNPTVQGIRQATFNINSDDPMLAVATVSLQCNGVVANRDVTPTKLDFSTTQQTGQCSSPQNVTIKNTGTDVLRILSVGFMGPNASSFQQPITTARVIPAGTGQLVIPVQFCPVDIGAQTADLVIVTDLTAGDTVKVPLTGTGTGPKVVANPGTLDFGPIYINTTSPSKTIAIRNDGDQPLIFGKSTVTAMSPFKVVGLPADGTKLNKGDPAIMLSVTANPTMAMQFSGEIAIVVNDQVKMGTLRIPLLVVGTQAEISVNPMMMSFPVTVIGTTSQQQMITVTNTGIAPLTGIDVVMAGTNSTDFVVTTSMLPATVPMGMSFQVPISFRPTAANSRNAIVVVKAAGLMAPTQVKVDGTGKLLTISCSPDDKNFGNVPVGTAKQDKVTCRNSDSSPIDFIAAFSDFPDDWSVDPSNGSLPGSMGGDDGLATLNLDFHPTSTGPRTTTLTIKTKDGITVGTVNIDGNGTTPPKDKMNQDVGCAYTGRTAPSYAGLLMLMLMGGLALLRRRRLA